MSRLLEVRDLKVWFPITRGILRRTVGNVRAVDGVSFDVERGQTVALVGESGCGKTTVGRALLSLLPQATGQVCFDGVDIGLDGRVRSKEVRRRMQMVFQDPMTALDPRMRVLDIVAEGIDAFGLARSAEEREAKVIAVLEKVQLSRDHLWRFPHEFSGGQKQRIGIARALAVEPDLIICDEAVSALDVSIQAQILNLLRDLKGELGVSYLFITHDLSVVRHLADRTLVMYLGQVVEQGPTDAVFQDPKHPYTRGLILAAPSADPRCRTEAAPILGDVPSPAAPPPGCRFHTRCPVAIERCLSDEPLPRELGGQTVACHLAK